MRRLLLLDDDPNVLFALERTLRKWSMAHELQIESFSDPLVALARAVEVDFAVAVSDYQMPPMSGIEFFRRFRQIQPNAVRLILSASTEFETVMRAVNEVEVFRYIPKPWQRAELDHALTLALERRDQADRESLEPGEQGALSELSPYERALRELEEQEPGITKVNWGPDGSVLLD